MGSLLGGVTGGVGDFLGGAGGGLGGMLGGLPLVGGFLGGGGGGSANPAAVPSAWLSTAGMPTPGTPGYPIQPIPGQGQTTYNFQGDLSTPGTAENFFAQNGGKFSQPTAAGVYWNQNAPKFSAPGQGEQYWNQVAGRFNAPKAVAQNAQGAYDQFQRTAPQDLSPYYDNAIRKATAGVNNAYGARGMFDSSAALQAGQDATTNLLAQQAKDNADYGLQRANTAGTLAQGADTSSRGASQDLLSWLSGGGQMANASDATSLARLLGGMNAAQGADSADLSKLVAGMGAASTAQNALQDRAQGYYNNLMGLGSAQANAMGSMYGPMISGDMGMLDQAIQASLGYPREALNQSISGRQQSEQGIGNLFGLIGGAKGAGLF